MRNAPLNPSFLAYKSQFDPYSANTVIYNLIAHCHWAMLNLSGLWEGEGGRGPLLLPALGKRTAGHLVLQAYDDFADVLLLLTPAGSCLQRGTGCLPLEAVRDSCHFPVFLCSSCITFPSIILRSCSPGERPHGHPAGQLVLFSLCSVRQDVCPLLWHAVTDSNLF